jgi:hypothetical protein
MLVCMAHTTLSRTERQVRARARATEPDLRRGGVGCTASVPSPVSISSPFVGCLAGALGAGESGCLNGTTATWRRPMCVAGKWLAAIVACVAVAGCGTARAGGGAGFPCVLRRRLLRQVRRRSSVPSRTPRPSSRVSCRRRGRGGSPVARLRSGSRERRQVIRARPTSRTTRHGGRPRSHRRSCSPGRRRTCQPVRGIGRERAGAGDRAVLAAPVPGVLDSRELLVSVFDLGGGQSAIDVNAEVTPR